MIEGREDFCFARETRHALGVARECFRQDLKRNVSTELRIACAINLAHPPSADGREDFARALDVCREGSPRVSPYFGIEEV